VNNKLASGWHHTCAILDNGDLKCWGYDNKGQLGDGGTNTDTSVPPSTAINLGTGRTAVAVAAGGYHTCAILDNGDLKCWGSDSHGQLGDGGTINTDTNAPSSTAIDLGAGRTAVAVAAGGFHTCALLDNGDVKCWGYDQYGNVGDGGSIINTNAPSSTAIDLGAGRTAVAVAAGDNHACAILDNGDLKCWGTNQYGGLGIGASTTAIFAPLSTAINLGAGRTAVAVSAGTYHTCAILDNGDAKCWGYDNQGQLGDGGSNANTNAPSSTAINLGTGRTAVAMAAAAGHTCAILDNGDMKCWGGDSWGQLGDGGSNTDTKVPSSTAIDLGTSRTAVALSAGFSFTCAILDNGDLKCWGYDGYGQLGDGGTSSIYNNQGSPVAVSGSNTWDSTGILITWSTHPALPAGMSISGGTISGTPSVYALNQTYTIYANQSGYSTTHELYFSVDTDNAHTVVENQTIDAIGFHPPFNNGTTSWTVSPALPGNLSIDGSTGEITGTVNATLANTTYTVTASHAYGPAANMSGSVTHPSGNSGSARGGSLAIDSDGFVHVAYCYSPDGGLFSAHKLGYMTDASGSWVATEIDSVCRESVIPQIVLNSNNSAHISYTKPGNTQPVMYATNVNGTWETSTLVSDLDASTVELSIFVDSNDAVHMAYCKYSGTVGSMYHITDASGAWVSTTIASMGGQSGCPSHDLVVDSNDNVYVAYHKTVYQGSDGLFIATNASGSWSVPSQSITNTTANGDGANPELTIDSNDNLHLIYSKSGSRSGVYYATCSVGCTTRGNWAQTTISTETVNHLSTSIDVDSNDKIHIAYMGTYNAVYAKFGTSYLATNANGTWVTTELHEEGYGVDLAIDLDHTYHLLLGWRPNAAYLSIGSTPVQTSSNYSASGFGSQTFTFNLQSLADYDGDGLPNDLPSDYDAAEGPTPGLVADSDDDGDGLDDSVETGTGNYVDGTDTGTNPLNPDTDGDGICDGPNAVAGVCVAGPDADPNGETFPPTLVALNNTAISTVTPYLTVSAGTFEISPDLPATLSLDATTGEITGTPTETTTNTTYTMWSNNSNGDSVSWNFTIEILEDSDGDGLPNELPGDYDPTNPDSPGLTEDLDDDADGVPDTNETDAGTSPTNPDTDGDGMCDGPNAVGGVCTAGPDAFPLDPSADTDTDGDGQPDTIDGNSTSVPPLMEDEDDDGDGLDDVNETNTGIYNSST
jgi:alpha-tubulin suppressor-like RCC1 family protein